MKAVVFRGVATAMITPFKDGRIDYESLGRLIEWQINAGIPALVIGGTTGEAATLDPLERYELYSFARKTIDGRCKLILGTGTNDTKEAIKHTKEAEKIGCDGVLVVTPYYNKGTREGIKRHYLAIADAVKLPIILYNVPSRTGVSLDTDTLISLSERENIVGIKEAADSLERLSAVAAIEGLTLYAGNDAAILSTLSLGGEGVISVVSNLYPKEAIEIYESYMGGDTARAQKKLRKLLPVINSLFLETNPAPIKYAMSRAGLCLSDMRLPMWLPTAKTKAKIDREIDKYNSL